MDERKKKIGIVTVCSLILVAMVVALVIGNQGGDEEDIPDVSSSQKAITTICETTDYQKACVDSLHGANTTNPKELIEVAFQSAINYIKEAAQNSTALREIQTDPRAQSALETCNDLANWAIEDLKRSYAKFNSFDITNFDDALLDLKIWLSGSITYQETCLDGFEGVPGDAGERMRESLTTAMQMTSNALAMVAEISTFLEAMGMQSFSSRRLLSEEDLPVLGHGGELPDWMDFDRRKLLAASPRKIIPNIIVAKDGSGNYRTINEALKGVPKKSNTTFVLYIKEGVYQETVRINSSLTHLMIIGDGPTKTRITGNLNFIDGTGTYNTATVAVQGDDFLARDIGFENSAGPEKHQAVALRVSADKAIFYNCHMDGYQDTLYAHTYRQFYRDCVISGTIDFVFGDSAAVFQGCTFLVRKPLDNQRCIVTAQGRKDMRQPTGLVLQNCSFQADPEYFPLRHKLKSYLGRPWKEYSRTIIMESFLDDLIQPDGWLPWNENYALDTLFYTEFNNRGPAAPKSQRVKWPGVKELPPNRIQRFTAAEFLDGNRWVPPTQIPYASGFIFPVPKEDPNIKYSPIVPEENKDLGAMIEKTMSAPPTPKNETGSFDQSPPISSSTTPPPSISPSVPQSEIAAPPVTSVAIEIIAPPVASPIASPVTFPDQSGIINNLAPSGSVNPDQQPNEAVASPQASPSGGVPVPTSQPATEEVAAAAAAPATATDGGSAALSPQSGTGESETAGASPPVISPASSELPVTQSEIAATPESSYSHANAPSS